MASIAPTPAQNSEDSPSRERKHHQTSRSDRVVCTACRQSKVRCVGTNHEPCSRCIRLGLDCRRDTNFKRVYKSRKIAELEKQVERLTSAFNGATGQTPNVPGPMVGQLSVPPSFQSSRPSDFPGTLHNRDSANLSQNSAILSITQLQVTSPPAGAGNAFGPGIPSIFHASEDIPPPWTGAREPAKKPRSIQSAFLSKTEIDKLFHIFFDQYNPFLPFLDPTRSPDEYYEAAPVLFWAIVSVASRRYSDDIMLFTALSEWVPKLVWSMISTPPYTVAFAQAIVLICAWPFPSDSMWHDTLTTLSAISVSICMQIGLHKPMNATDFQKTKTIVDEKECRIRTAIWAAATIVSQNVESTIGILPSTPFDTTIDLACQTGTIYTLPDNLRIKLMIQRYCHKVTKLVCSYWSVTPDLEATQQFSLPWQKDIDLLETELNSIEHENAHKLTVYDRIHIAEARLYASSMSFFDPSDTEPRKREVLKAYNYAASFILAMMEADARGKFFSHINFYHGRMFLIAIFTLVKVLRSSYSSDIDSEAGKKLCNRAVGCIPRCSVANNDSAAKSAKLVAQVWHSSNTAVLQEPPRLLVKSRLGASMLYDFVWTWRQEFGNVLDAYPTPNRASQMDQDNILMSQGFFEDASMVDLDFLNDPNWVESLISPMV